jgi:hypothetical protein
MPGPCARSSVAPGISGPGDTRALALPGLTLLTRTGCGLCVELQDELARLATTRPLPELRMLDVDANSELQRRYGHHIPVLLLDGVEVCRHRLDATELLRLLRR